jgi:predicted esterase
MRPASAREGRVPRRSWSSAASVEGWRPDLSPPFPPIAIAHGTYDAVIPVEFGRAARDTLTAAGADVVYRESPIDHSIDPRSVEEFRAVVVGSADRV